MRPLWQNDKILCTIFIDNTGELVQNNVFVKINFESMWVIFQIFRSLKHAVKIIPSKSIFLTN